MKHTALTILVSITLALVCVLLIFNFLRDNSSLPSISPQTATDNDDLIKVYGQGKVSLRPDVAYITLGIENMELSPKAAHDKNTQQMTEVINALKDAGIAQEDIQTSRYNIYQEYDHSNGTRQLRGYRVTNNITIKVREIDKASDMIDVAFNAGGNVFQDITFDILNRQEAYLEAMDIALERAREKAESFAQKAGKVVVDVKEITENYSASSYRYQPMNNLIQAMPVPTGAPKEDGAISAGELQIVAKVDVTYKLGN